MNVLDSIGLSYLWEKIKGIVPTKTSQLENDTGFLSGNGDVDISGSLTVDGSASVGTSVELGGAASGHGGSVDFHFNGSTGDYTSRIIEAANGVLYVNPGKSVSLGKIANSTDVLNTLFNPTGRNTITNFNGGIALTPGLWYVFTTDGTAANAPYGGYVGGICLVAVTYKSDGTINKAYQLFMDDDGDVYYKVFKYGVSYGTWKKLTG